MTKGRGERGKGQGEREKGKMGEKKSNKSRSPITRSRPSPFTPFRRRSVAPSSPAPISTSFHPIVPPVITLLTDFGSADYFVSAMKGVILSRSANTRIVDITHEIPAQDIAAAAFALLTAYSSFPTGTIYVAVVDPGVGSSRRAILVVAGGRFFVGPDNGIFSYVCEREPGAKVFELTNESYFRQPVSATFHARDIFAPVSAALAQGINPEQLGSEIKNEVRLAPLVPERLKNGNLKARIMHIDRFGNCITNLTPNDLSAEEIASGARIRVNATTIKQFKEFFAQETGKSDGLFAIWGSAGFLEIAAANRSAADMLKAKRGQSAIVLMPPD